MRPLLARILRIPTAPAQSQTERPLYGPRPTSGNVSGAARLHRFGSFGTFVAQRAQMFPSQIEGSNAGSHPRSPPAYNQEAGLRLSPEGSEGSAFLHTAEARMHCLICKWTVTRSGTRTVTFERRRTTRVFKSVPAQLCENCGESYVDEQTRGELFEAVPTLLAPACW